MRHKEWSFNQPSDCILLKGCSQSKPGEPRRGETGGTGIDPRDCVDSTAASVLSLRPCRRDEAASGSRRTSGSAMPRRIKWVSATIPTI